MSDKRGKALFVASIFRDLVAVSTNFPRPGETITGSKFFTGFGGKGANQCVMAARLGARTTIVAKVGDDENGAAYRQNLEKEGVDIRHLGVEIGITTGVASIMVESSTGENLIVIVPGASDRLEDKDVRKAAKDILSSAVVVGVLEVGEGAVLEAFKTARQSGVATVLNAAPARKDVSQELLDNTDYLCVNETEAEVMSGEADVEEAARILHKQGCSNVIITLGAAGALILEQGGKAIRVSGTKLEGAVVDTTGAGDAFVGSLAYFIASHPSLNLEEKVQRSCSLASLTVMKPGTQLSYPHREEVEHVING